MILIVALFSYGCITAAAIVSGIALATLIEEGNARALMRGWRDQARQELALCAKSKRAILPRPGMPGEEERCSALIDYAKALRMFPADTHACARCGKSYEGCACKLPQMEERR